MPLEDAEQVGDVPAPVVYHLGTGAARPTQEDAAHPDEGFGIGRAGQLVDDGADPAREVALASKPRGNGGGLGSG